MSYFNLLKPILRILASDLECGINDLNGAGRCLGTAQPREFGPGPLGILTNLTELVVHEIEAAGERALQRQQSEKLLAAMDLYQDAFMLVDTTVPKWRILHLNLMAANEIGVLPVLTCRLESILADYRLLEFEV